MLTADAYCLPNAKGHCRTTASPRPHRCSLGRARCLCYGGQVWTTLVKCALREVLATSLIQHEVVDRSALDRVVAVLVPEAESLNKWG